VRKMADKERQPVKIKNPAPIDVGKEELIVKDLKDRLNPKVMVGKTWGRP